MFLLHYRIYLCGIPIPQLFEFFKLFSLFALLDVDINECADGYNFDLDLDVLSFRRRKAFDLVGTATNGGMAALSVIALT